MSTGDRLETALRTAYDRHTGDDLRELRYLPPDRSSSRRASWRTPAAVVSCAVVVVAVIVLALVVGRGNGPDQKVRLGQPQSGISRPPAGTVAVPEQVPSALVTADGRTIYTTATGGGCTPAASLTATATATAVVLHLDGYTITGNHVGCLDYATRWTRSTTLATALDGRRLIDGSTGRPVPYLDGRDLADVTWLPAGASVPANSLTDGWTRGYTFPRSLDAGPIAVSQSSTDLLHSDEFRPDPGQAIHNVRINGHRAVLVTQTENGTLLQDRLGWDADGYTFIVRSQPENSHQHPFSTDVIERVARGVQPQPSP
jgi:hypothetical protein